MTSDRVVVLATGGTIASIRRSGGYQPGMAADELRATAPPGLAIESRDVTTVSSFDLTAPLLLHIATEAARVARDPDVSGVVVTHGTDTMEETAFLTSLLHDGSVPIVFTGAQIPGGEQDSDGPANLGEAIRLAAAPASRGRGVLISFAGTSLPALGAQKRSSVDAAAFSSRRCGPPPEPSPRYVPFPGLEALEVEVRLVTSAVADDGRAVLEAVRGGARGVVLQAFGLGNAGVATVEAVRRATRRGVVVVVTSRTSHGPVLARYGGGGGGVDLAAAGAILAGDLSGPQARILLMAALSGRSTEEAGQHVRRFVDASTSPNLAAAADRSAS